jgi:cbb3-type cytochrome oxidase subunit 3
MKWYILVGLEILFLFLVGYLAWEGIFRANGGEAWVVLFIVFLALCTIVFGSRREKE